MAKKKKGKQAKGGAPDDAVSLVAHPRARRSIRRLRGRAGLVGLVAVTWLSLRAGVPPFDAVLRGLAGGVAVHFVAWGAGILAWRHLVLAELTAYRNAAQAKRDALRAAAAERAADVAANR